MYEKQNKNKLIKNIPPPPPLLYAASLECFLEDYWEFIGKNKNLALLIVIKQLDLVW